MSEPFVWGHARRYNDYPTYIKKQFGGRIQKISVNVGFSCPNRDGTKGVGGCIYCDNSTFKPGYCEPEISVRKQIQTGVSFFEQKYPDILFMAYFQSYTNTYAPINELRAMYLEALDHPKIMGLIVGTRPDCINPEILYMLKEISANKPVTIELGLESTLDKTLQIINRYHTWSDSVQAITWCHQRGINVGVHLILGLPGETHEMMLNHAKLISTLPIHSLKLHQLQVIKNTQLAALYKSDPNYVHLFDAGEYIQLVIEFLECLNPKIVIERFVSVSPVEKLIAPKWNQLKNFEIVAIVEKTMEAKNTWQGRLYEP
ncbi:MAG: TIGR01212 family radical SAM protein [Salinivirgaceae bacterium]